MTAALSVAALTLTLGAAVFVPSSGAVALTSAAPSAASDDGNWLLTTNTYSPSGENGYVPTYLGNGYIGSRIAAEGTGFSNAPITTESQLAGFYGQGPGTTVQRANLPAWSTVGFSDGSGTFGDLGSQGCALGALCEAESGTLVGTARIATDHPGYTGTGFVAGFAASGNVSQRGSTDTVRIDSTVAGAAVVTVRYSAGANKSSQTLGLSVGATHKTLTMPATADWDTWSTASLPITLDEGANDIALTCGTTDTCVANIDSFVVTAQSCSLGQTCEAESGDFVGSTKIATDHTGYTGTGFVAGFAASGNTPQRGTSDTLHIAGGVAGTATLSVRYSAALNSSAQTLSASVNGGDPMSFSMPATASWNTWATATIPVTIKHGTNTIALTCGATDTCIANVDSVTLATGDTTSQGGVSNYQQTLDLHNGLLTTDLTWTSPAGNKTALTFTVMVSRARAHVAAVRVTARPLGWSGSGSFLDLLDGRADTLPVSHRTSAAINLTNVSNQAIDKNAHRISEKASTVVLGADAGIASTLTIEGDNGPTSSMADVPAQSIGQQGTVDMNDGQTYTVTKYVGIASDSDTSDGSAPLVKTTSDPVADAVTASSAAESAGWDKLLAEHEAAWAELWKSNVSIPGDDALTLKARASMFYLLGSIRDGVDWSMSPGGLSSAEYNGHVFWDAETWMYPALLAAHPDLASGMNDYRLALLDAAKATATKNGFDGAQFPWESAQSGADVGIHPREIHITGDIALAQWDYYQATGDLQWLRDKGWPIFEAVAQYYVSRSTPDGKGGYDLKGVEGPDENHNNVNNSAYVNVAAITSLQIAEQAAELLGRTPDPKWADVATGLAASIPFDPATNTHPEYDGYSGQTVNQADVIMMQYPWQYSMDKDVAQADLDYYAPRTSLTGPAMTDAINMIDTADLSTHGCSAYTYFQRSIDPYDVGPFDQYSEHLGATGVIDFTTGIGGFLQELYYGFTGWRMNDESVVLDPMLPPQLPGVNLTKLQWQGRTFDIDIAPNKTTITLESGDPMPLTVAGKKLTVSAGAPVFVDTRRPDKSPTDDVARCASVDATSSDLSNPATAAVDGSDATSWKPTTTGAALTVDLGSSQPVRHVDVLATGATTAYTVDVSTDGTEWTKVGTASAGSSAQSSVDLPSAVQARFVRYTAATGATPSLRSLTVTSGLPNAPTAVHAGVVENAKTTLTWTAPTETGDGPISGYLITPYKNGKPQTPERVANVTTADVGNLDSGADYAFTVSATNDSGDGAASTLSNTVRWDLPGAPPIVHLSTDPATANGTEGWFTSAVTVTATATSDGVIASTEISLDGGGWTAGVSPSVPRLKSTAATTSVKLTTDGTHTVRARATDSEGNVSKVVSQTIKLDTAPPVSKAAIDTKARTLTVHSGDAVSGVARIEYRIGDAGSWSTYASPVDIGDAAVTVQYRALDHAGNVEAVKTLRVPQGAGSSLADTGSDPWALTLIAAVIAAAGAALMLRRKFRRTRTVGHRVR